ncbi:hypothetical protein [Chryseobacterium sp. POE27]|uniref:hypothetical protein n=1 Tax=Chryseobacterium sp. POE27 TaxID=3138177 RepID=UPI003219A66E
MKKLIIFDLDGTLALSKSSVDQEMARLLDSLLDIAKVAIIKCFKTRVTGYIAFIHCKNILSVGKKLRNRLF